MTLLLDSNAGRSVQHNPHGATSFDVYSAAFRAHVLRSVAGPVERVSGLVAGIPASFIEAYADEALMHADSEMLDSGEWYVSMDALPGVWATGATPDEAFADMRDAILGWVSLRLQRGAEIPAIGGVYLSGPPREQAS